MTRPIDDDARFMTYCGWGTPWGCRRPVGYPAHILLHGRAATTYQCGGYDDGHVLFHAACSPAVVEPDAVRRWRGTWTARREAEVV